MRIVLADQPGIDPAESQTLGDGLAASLTALLEGLTPDEWATTTRCAPWTAKDMAAHILGWADALTSFKELSSQSRRALSRVKEYGNITDAQNSIQVDDRAGLSTQELVTKLREGLRKEAVARRRYGKALRYVPFYMPYLGGATNVGYLFNTIFLRDLVVHRLDLYDALGREPELTAADRRVMTDMLKDWARRTKADVQIEDAGTFYVAGAGVHTISSPLHHVIDVLSGRRDPGSLAIDGDRARVEAWLAQRVPV